MQFSKTTLNNGVRVITAPMEGNPTVTVMVGIATGSFNESPEQAGISHFLEHMCFKGTGRRASARAITTELDSIGASYNASTGSEYTSFYVKSTVGHFDTVADIISDIALNSTFPEAEIKKEKGVVKGEIDMYADDPQEKLFEAMRRHMYDGQPAGRDILGTKETVDAITRDALIAYRDKQYVGPNVVVSIAGGIGEGRMIAWAEETFGRLPSALGSPMLPTVDRAQSGVETVVVDKDTDQAHVILAWRTFPRGNSDRRPAFLARQVLRAGMSSRLSLRLRDELGSGYYISGSHSLSATFGRFIIATGTTHERVPEIVQAIVEEVERLKREDVPAAELAKVKEHMRAHRLMGLETSDDLADYLMDQEIIEGRIRTPQEFEALYETVSAADVRRVSGTVFDHGKLTIGVIGKGIDPQALKDAVSKAVGA